MVSSFRLELVLGRDFSSIGFSHEKVNEQNSFQPPRSKKTIKISTKCSGSGTSGRAMAFCVGQLGSNTEMDLGFFQFRIAVDLLSLGVGLF